MSTPASSAKSSDASILSMSRGAASAVQGDFKPSDASGLGRLLTAGEVAEILSVSLSMAYKLIERGQIPSVRIGRLVRVGENELYRAISSPVR